MACDSDSLLLLHVAPCSFNPVGSSQDLSPVVAAVRLCDAVHGAGMLPAVTSHTSERQQRRKATSNTGEQARVRGQGAAQTEGLSAYPPWDPNSPVTPKLQASRVALWEVVTLTSRQSSSRDQLLAWATYCLVAVMYASGTNRPPRHTWMFCGRKQRPR